MFWYAQNLNTTNPYALRNIMVTNAVIYLMSNTNFMIEPKETKLPTMYLFRDFTLLPTGWLAGEQLAFASSSINKHAVYLYISRHEDRSLLVFISGLCRLTYLRDEEMKHWHRHHFLVDEYIGHFNSCSDQVHCIDVHTLGFLPGFSLRSHNWDGRI